MADSEITGDVAPKKKRVVNRGARGPQQVYVFAKIDPQTGKIAKQAVAFRDPRKMADRLQNSNEDGEQLLVVTPE